MAQTLYLRETDGSRIILNQCEQYGDVRIGFLNQTGELKRGGVITGEELFRLALECLNRQSAEKGDASTRPLCPSNDFGCPHWTESGHCTLEDPAHNCDDYMYYNGVDTEND